jgi:parallel beta-helix repeat protein
MVLNDDPRASGFCRLKFACTNAALSIRLSVENLQLRNRGHMHSRTYVTPPCLCLLLSFFLAAILAPASVGAQVKLSVDPTSMSLETYEGTNAPSRTVRITNAGKGSMKWSVVNLTSLWLKVSPTSGTNTGTLTLTFATSGLKQSTSPYKSSFRVDSNGGNVPVDVYVTVLAPPVLTVSCPSNMTVASPDGLPVVVTYSVGTSGGVPPVTVTGSPASGTSFGVGTTPVSVVARSSDGQEQRCAFNVTVTYSPGSSPTGVGPQPTITCPTEAVIIYPENSHDFPSIVSASDPGTTFCLRAGVHYMDLSVIPKTGDTFIGEYGAIVDGTRWTTENDLDAAFRAYNQDIDNVTISNLSFRNLRRAIHGSGEMTSNWTIQYNDIGPNYSGIVFPSASLIRNNYIHDNSWGGYEGLSAHNSLIENNEIARNGWEQKIVLSTNVTFRNNFVHHNAGAGIWYDSDNTAAVVEGNRVEDNGWIGIFYEISGDGIIRNNTIRRSGDAGVFLSTSKNTQIYNNTLDNNFRGITYFVNCPAVGGGSIVWDLTNDTSHDNTIIVGTQSGALASNFSYTSCTAQQLAAYQNGAKGLTFSHNSYDVPLPSTGQYWYWNGLKTWIEWQQRGQDLDSVVQ